MKEKISPNLRTEEAHWASFFKASFPSNRRLREVYSQIIVRRVKVVLFRTKSQGTENFEQVKNLYLANAKAINFITRDVGKDVHGKAFEKAQKEEVLRRFKKDCQVAERFFRAGLLRELIEIEEEEIQLLLQDPLKFRIINPQVTKLCKELERKEELITTVCKNGLTNN
ncbi:hypothetical protein A2Z23_01910 [Candidatus Curtissbacteria bacterium RBG_16_39_7]|uniref:Uncharacterized protein n=1 Tax=Candidatus Curtissbacteria bacterium RBG_16_39_7 TaxID=1797707 RepID=A0A1F5G480_9BACT|nr:MAG: hypothetical protein A2Z23_01910 [Candidatus Curtissbacteria bacterium RBG_16_39_7]